MGKLISEVDKFDTAVSPASVTGAITGQYFGMNCYRTAAFVVMLGFMAAGATSEIQVMQAIDASGTDAKAITGATVTITANEDSTRLKLSIVSAVGGIHVAGETVTINGNVFTAATVDNPNTREYAVGADGAESAANLLAKINSSNEDIGVEDVFGIADVDGLDSLIRLKATETGTKTVSAVASASTTVVSTIEAIAYIDLGVHALDVNTDFTHIALKVTNSAAMQTSAILLRDNARYTPVQNVAGEVAVLSS